MRKSICIILVLGLFLSAAAVISAAAGAPGVRVLDSLKDAYTSVRFDHSKHVAIADNCAACHHEHSAGNGLPCKQCHALTPTAFKNSVRNSFTPCKNCHGAFDRDNPRMPGLKTAYHQQCFTCHRGMNDIGSSPKGCTETCHAKRQEKVGNNIR